MQVNNVDEEKGNTEQEEIKMWVLTLRAPNVRDVKGPFLCYSVMNDFSLMTEQ